MDGDADLLTLADWRRTVATLYADVRALAASDVRAAWDLWRVIRERLYREHPQSPVPIADRGTFRARHWPYDEAVRFEVRLEPAPPSPLGGALVALPDSGGDVLSFRRLGRVTLPLDGGARQLAVYWMSGYAGGLFIPFRDATNGTETYGAGRYLVDAAKSADLGGDAARGTLILDFNFAYQPSCAFDPKWACPLAPPENRLDVPVRAGERLA
jgi:uncharacterized protein (DUF1684 family)